MWAETALGHLHPCERVFCRLPFFCRLIERLSVTLSSSSKSSISRSLAMSVGSFIWAFNSYMKDTSAKICLYQNGLCKILSYLHSVHFTLNSWDTPQTPIIVWIWENYCCSHPADSKLLLEKLPWYLFQFTVSGKILTENLRNFLTGLLVCDKSLKISFLTCFHHWPNLGYL